MRLTDVFLPAALVMLSFLSSAQEKKEKVNAIELAYNWAHPGGNISLNYLRWHDCWGYTIGIKWHQNQPVRDNMNYAYRHRGYAGSFTEALGLNIGVVRKFSADDRLEPFFYGMGQFSLLRWRNEYWIYQARHFTIVSQPSYVAEITAGIGINIRITKRFYFTQSAGGGVFLLRGQRALYPSSFGAVDWNFCGLLRAGLQYRF